IHLQDARDTDDELETEITRRLPVRAPIRKVFNKLDLLDPSKKMGSDHDLHEQGRDLPPIDRGLTTIAPIAPTAAATPAPLYISAKTGEGLDVLRQRLLDIAGGSPGADSPCIARERHVRALEAAGQHLAIARTHADLDDQVLDLFAEELRLAHEE